MSSIILEFYFDDPEPGIYYSISPVQYR